MTEADVYDVLADALMAVLLASAPVLILALGVGLAIALFQALTQIQEMTLTFVPKILAIFLALLAALPFMYSVLDKLATQVFDLIVSNGL